MGEKVELKRIDNPTKFQVLLAKRRTGLIKRVHETSGTFNTNVAFLGFSPSGHVSKFCNQIRFDDVLGRYCNLPAEKRNSPIKNVENKLENHKQIDDISEDEIKLHYLKEEIKLLEQQIRKSELLETFLSNHYEPDDPAYDPPLYRFLRCESEFKHSLQRVKERKRMVLANFASSTEKLRIQKEQKEREIKAISTAISHDFGRNEQLIPGPRHPYCTPLLMQLDPWLSPYSPKVRKAMLQELSPQQKSELFAVDHEVKLFNYSNPTPVQGLSGNESSYLSQQLRTFDVSKHKGRFGHDVSLVAQPQQYPTQTTQNQIYQTEHDALVPKSYLYGNGTNHYMNSSNNNINFDWNPNSFADNHVNSSTSGDFNTNADNGNQNSIANKHVAFFDVNHKTNAGNGNQTSLANNHVNSSASGNCIANVVNGNWNSIATISGNQNTNVDNGNRNPIANKHVNMAINGNHKMDVVCWNKTNIDNWIQSSFANNHVTLSADGNYNTNVDNGNQNSIANSHVISLFINGDKYNANITNWNQNSITNNNEPLSSESINNDMNDKNIGIDTNDKHLEEPNGVSVEATKSNDIVVGTEGDKEMASWESWDGVALAKNLNSKDIDICF